jgi:hypothetical protein
VFAAYGIIIVAIALLVSGNVLARGPAGPSGMKELIFYPFSAALAGLALFIMGARYWGRCYEFGLAFFVLAMLMPLKLEWAPLEFGLLWGVVLTAFGIHLRRLAEILDKPEENA